MMPLLCTTVGVLLQIAETLDIADLLTPLSKTFTKPYSGGSSDPPPL